jgi:hypothetical protein
MRSKQVLSPVKAILENDQIRRILVENQVFYAAVDVIAALSDSQFPAEIWNDLKQREPQLERDAVTVEFLADVESIPEDGVDLDGVLRVVQSIPGDKAERVKRWLAQSGRHRIEEMNNPELALVRARKLYLRKGKSRSWVDKRIRALSARHELVHEWASRGATDSEDYRTLTNELMNKAFGMDVESYRRHKHLSKPGEKLRDHMTDLELVLTMLGETTASLLSRDRDSHSISDLRRDVTDAGEIAARTRAEIERRSGHSAINPGTSSLSNHKTRPE